MNWPNPINIFGALVIEAIPNVTPIPSKKRKRNRKDFRVELKYGRFIKRRMVGTAKLEAIITKPNQSSCAIFRNMNNKAPKKTPP